MENFDLMEDMKILNSSNKIIAHVPEIDINLTCWCWVDKIYDMEFLNQNQS